MRLSIPLFKRWKASKKNIASKFATLTIFIIFALRRITEGIRLPILLRKTHSIFGSFIQSES